MASPKTAPRVVPEELRQDPGMADRVIQGRREREFWVQDQRTRGLEVATKLKDFGSFTLPEEGTWEEHIVDAFLTSDEHNPHDLLPSFRTYIMARYQSIRRRVPRLPLWSEFLDAYRAEKK
jgi:hypothetical protein